MGKVFHKAIYVVGLVTTVVYTVKAVQYAMPIVEQVAVDLLAKKLDVVINEEDTVVKGPVNPPTPQKKDHITFTVNIPRRRK